MYTHSYTRCKGHLHIAPGYYCIRYALSCMTIYYYPYISRNMLLVIIAVCRYKTIYAS